MESYRVLGWMGLNYIALNDLSREVQASVNKGQEFTATCRVGGYIIGGIQLEDCRR